MSQTQRLGLVALCGAGLFVLGLLGHSKTPPSATLALAPEDSLPKPSSAPAARSQVVVDVVGAVRKPGVVKLGPDDRVEDAIRMAGGATSDADLEQINLAAKLVDGTQIDLPKKGSAPTPAPQIEPAYAGNRQTDARAGQGSRSSARKSPAGIVHLNTASEGQLESLPGVGPSTAAKIIEYRKEHGGFGSVDELLQVKGIGPKKMEAMRKFLSL